MATGSLTDSPWLFEKLSGQSSLQAPRARGRLPLAGYPQGRLPEGDPASKTFLKKSTRWPTPGSRPQEDRLPEAGHEESRLPEAGQDCTHQGCTHITVIRRGVAAVQPTTPESRNRHGHRAPYGSAIPRPARHCSHVGLDVTHDRCQYGPWAAGPFARETSEDGLASSVGRDVAGSQ